MVVGAVVNNQVLSRARIPRAHCRRACWG